MELSSFEIFSFLFCGVTRRAKPVSKGLWERDHYLKNKQQTHNQKPLTGLWLNLLLVFRFISVSNTQDSTVSGMLCVVLGKLSGIQNLQDSSFFSLLNCNVSYVTEAFFVLSMCISAWWQWLGIWISWSWSWVFLPQLSLSL